MVGEGFTYFYVPYETAWIAYTVTVTPPPADVARATIYKHALGGEVVATQDLVKEGRSRLSIPLAQLTKDDSPLFVELHFERKARGRKTLVQTLPRAISLAEPAPKVIVPAATEAKVGDKVHIDVTEWVALAYDSPPPAPPTPLPERNAARVPAAVKRQVEWKVDDEVLPEKGASIDLEIKDAHKGKTLKVEAYVRELRGWATTAISVVVHELAFRVHREAADWTYPLVEYTVEMEDGTVVASGKTDPNAEARVSVPRAGSYKVKLARAPLQGVAFTVYDGDFSAKLASTAVALVDVDGTRVEATTDAEGAFRVAKVAAGPGRIEVGERVASVSVIEGSDFNIVVPKKAQADDVVHAVGQADSASEAPERAPGPHAARFDPAVQVQIHSPSGPVEGPVIHG